MDLEIEALIKEVALLEMQLALVKVSRESSELLLKQIKSDAGATEALID